MARFEVTGPDGARYEITAPDTATEADIAKVVNQQLGGKSEPEMGALEAGGRGALQGVTFGFSDEIYGAGRGALSAIKGQGFSDEYAKGRDEARDANKRAAASNPIAYYGGEIAGGIALPFGAARAGAGLAARVPNALAAPLAAAGRAAGFGQTAASAGLGLGARSVAAAREGAAYGAAYGLGQGEGGAGEQALNVGRGALLGGAVGAAVPGLVDTGAAIARGVTTPYRAVTQPQQVGREKVAEALLRDVSGESVARQPSYGEALNRIESRLASGRDAGKDLMLADVGGENTRNLMRAAGNQQSSNAERLRKRLDVRQSNQWSRIEGDLADTLADPRDFATSVGDIVARRRAEAGPAFDAARAIETPMTPQLASVLRRPTMQNVLQMSERRLADEGEPIGLATRTAALHRAKVELDTQIGAARRAQQMGNAPAAGMDVRTLTILKRDLMAAIDNPAYRRALDNYAGDSALIGAADDGFERALTMQTEEIRQTIDGLGTQAEREMWRLGAARALADKVRAGNVNRDRTDGVFSSPDMQMRLRAIMPNQRAYREFQRSLIMEAKMADTRKALQGNSTTAKQLAQADEAGQPMRAAVGVAQAATGRMEPMLNLLGRTAQRFSGITPTSANAIIEAGMERNPQAISQSLRNALAQAEQTPHERARIVRGLLSGAAGYNSGQ